MKIKTIPAYYGKPMTVTIDGTSKEIKFDHTGIAQVNDTTGKLLVEKYQGLIFDEGFKAETAKTPEQEYTKEVAQRLEAEVNQLKEQVASLKDDKKGVEADLEEWKAKIGEMTQVITTKEKELDEEKISSQKVIEGLELKINLMGNNTETLKSLCKDAGFPKEEWDKMVKDDLIEYIINKS